MNKTLLPNYLRRFYPVSVLFILLSYHSVYSASSILNTSDTIPNIEINNETDITITVKGTNLSSEGSYYLTSYKPEEKIEESKIILKGEVDDIVKNGNYLYVACDFRGHMLMVFDISDINNPKAVFIYDGKGDGSKIRIFGKYLFFLTYDFGDFKGDTRGICLIFDISNPSAPEFITDFNDVFSYNNKPVRVNDIYIENNVAYILSDDILCLDIQNIHNPKLISSLKNVKTYIIEDFKDNKLTIKGLPLWDSKHGQVFSIVDFSDQLHPKLIDFTDILKKDIDSREIKSTYKSRIGKPYYNLKYYYLKDTLFVQLTIFISSGGSFRIPEWTGENDLLIAYRLLDNNRIEYIDTFTLNGNGQFIFSVDNYVITLNNTRRIEKSKTGDLVDIKIIEEQNTDYFLPDKKGVNRLGKEEISKLNLSNTKFFFNKHFLKTNHAINLYDISNPDEIQETKLVPFKSQISYVEIKDNTAYIANGDQGLILVDIGDPDKPEIINEFKARGSAYKFSIKDNLLFLADNIYGIRILDIHNSMTIKELGSIEINEFIYDIAVNKDQIAVLTESGLKIFNYDAQFNVKIVYETKLGVKPFLARLNFYKDKLYIPAILEKDLLDRKLIIYEYDGLNDKSPLKEYPFNDNESSSLNIGDFIIDHKNNRGFIATPNAIQVIKFEPEPSIFDEITTEGNKYITHVKYMDNKLYIGSSNDITIYSEKEEIFQHITDIKPNSGPIKDFDIKNGLVFIGTHDALNIIKPDYEIKAYYEKNPGLVTKLEKGSYIFGNALAIKDNYLISAVGGLRIFDTNDNFKLVFDSLKLNGKYLFADHIDINGNYLFLLSFKGLKIIDIKNIAAPKFISEYKHNRKNYSGSDTPSSIFVKDNYAFITHGMLHAGFDQKDFLYLQIVDISDIRNPVLAGEYQTKANLVDVKIRDNVAYLVDNGRKSGLDIIDISDKKKPKLIKEFRKEGKESPLRGVSIIFKGEYAFLAYNKSIHILNITDINNPKFISEIIIDFSITRMVMSGDILFIIGSGYDANLAIINISNTLNPYIVSINKNYKWAQNICVDDKYIYVYDERIGIMVHQKPFRITNINNIDKNTTELVLKKGTPKGTYQLKYFSPDGISQNLFNVLIK